MASNRGRAEAVRLLWRRLFLVGLALIVAGAASGVWNVYQKDRESALLNQQAQVELSQLQMENSELSGDIASLQTERGQEAALRQAYAVGHQGEGEVMIIEPATPAPLQATTTFLDKVGSFFSRW